MINNIAVVGLGKLGATMAACLASRNFNVIGLDISEKAVEALNAGHSPVQETGLEELISCNKKRLRATMSYDDAIMNTDLSFVIVPTPSDERGAFSLKYVAEAFEAIGKALAKKEDYHVVVLTSTVLPGSTRFNLLPILEKFSGKKCGEEFGVCYSPEFIALGSIIRDFLNPDFYLVGEYDERSGAMLEAVNSKVALNNCPSKRMNIENAELSKIAVNSFVTLKISYANMLSDLCERIPGGNIDIVSDAIGSDKRIGKQYLKGGFGYGGPCFPRDNVALNFIGKHLGAATQILEVNDEFNRNLAPRFVEKIKPYLHENSIVAVLGLSYKPLSHIVEESAGIYLCNALAYSGMQVIGYDPLANGEASRVLERKVCIASSIQECLKDATIVIVTTPDDIFKNILPSEYLQNKQCITVVDVWRCLDEAVQKYPNIKYVPVGQCLNESSSINILNKIWNQESQQNMNQNLESTNFLVSSRQNKRHSESLKMS